MTAHATTGNVMTGHAITAHVCHHAVQNMP